MLNVELVARWRAQVGAGINPGNSESMSGRRRCFDLRSILTFAPAGIGWAMADACEATDAWVSRSRISVARKPNNTQAFCASGQHASIASHHASEPYCLQEPVFA